MSESLFRHSCSNCLHWLNLEWVSVVWNSAERLLCGGHSMSISLPYLYWQDGLWWKIAIWSMPADEHCQSQPHRDNPGDNAGAVGWSWSSHPSGKPANCKLMWRLLFSRLLILWDTLGVHQSTTEVAAQCCDSVLQGAGLPHQQQWQLIHQPALSHHLHWVKRASQGGAGLDKSSLFLPAAEMLLLQQTSP